MRTKTMLLSAALFAAGALSSMAQSAVYSQNVVGYVTVTVYPGLNLVSAPLQSASSTSNPQTVLANVTPVLPVNSSLYVFNPTNSLVEAPSTFAGGPGFNSSDTANGDNTWSDPDFNSPPYDGYGDCAPGSSFFIFNYSGPIAGNAPVTNTITIVGTVPQGSTALKVYAGINFLADPEPVAQDITTNGFPIQNNDQLYTWGDGGYYTDSPVAVAPWGLGGAGSSGYNQSISGDTLDFAGPGFSDDSFNEVPVALTPGQGFVYVNVNSTATWTRTFTVQ